MDVFLNGEFVPADQARISVDDAGLQHAVGLFETMSARHGRVFRLERHLSRLARSAQELGLSPEIDTAALGEAVRKTLQRNDLEQARVRLTLTAGSLSLLRPAEQQKPRPTLLIVPTPPTEYDPRYFEEGITVLIAPPAANPFNTLDGHKTLSYWARLRTLRQAAAAGAGEAIWLNVSNHLASGAISNVFLVRDGVLCTPIAHGEEEQGALAAPVLPGVTREAVIGLAEAAGVEVRRKMLSVEDMLDAEEVFLTNSSWGVLPVSRVEKHEIGEGGVGPLTSRLRTALGELVDSETRNGGGDSRAQG